MHNYLRSLFVHQLSRRQGILLTLLYTGIDHLERISDHVARMAELTQLQRRQPSARFSSETLEAYLALNEMVCDILSSLQKAISPDCSERQAIVKSVIAARDVYMEQASRHRKRMASDLSHGQGLPLAVLYRHAYLSHLNRIVRHAKSLAETIGDRDFHIKTAKLERGGSD
jgi:Na+/phosphate symporter